MTEIQAWFQPLLWIVGTIVALGTFIRFCKPLWDFIQSPKKVSAELAKTNEDVTAAFKAINTRLDEFAATLDELKEHDKSVDQVQQDLLRDRLNQGFHYYDQAGYLSEEAYRSFCEMYSSYKRLKGNSFIDTVMEQITDLYKKSAGQKNNPDGIIPSQVDEK